MSSTMLKHQNPILGLNYVCTYNHAIWHILNPPAPCVKPFFSLPKSKIWCYSQIVLFNTNILSYYIKKLYIFLVCAMCLYKSLHRSLDPTVCPSHYSHDFNLVNFHLQLLIDLIFGMYIYVTLMACSLGQP